MDGDAREVLEEDLKLAQDETLDELRGRGEKRLEEELEECLLVEIGFWGCWRRRRRRGSACVSIEEILDGERVE